jgi:hypothetical protein
MIVVVFVSIVEFQFCVSGALFFYGTIALFFCARIAVPLPMRKLCASSSGTANHRATCHCSGVSEFPKNTARSSEGRNKVKLLGLSEKYSRINLISHHSWLSGYGVGMFLRIVPDY